MYKFSNMMLKYILLQFNQKETKMATQPNRITLPLDESSIALLKRIESLTGSTAPQTIGKLWPSHLADLWEYVTWLEQLPEGPGRLRSLGENMLQSYGPETLVESIKRVDPAYVTEGEKSALAIKAGA